jgi:hypothetical protein
MITDSERQLSRRYQTSLVHLTAGGKTLHGANR